MSALDRQTARARCAAATEPPWHINPDKPYGPNVHHGVTAEGIPITVADAEFIAAARADLPAALDALDRADTEVDRLRAALERVASFESRHGPSDEANLARRALGGEA